MTDTIQCISPVDGLVYAERQTATYDEALAQMNDSHYRLTASLWTGNAERAARTDEHLQTATVFMNRADYVDPALCWSGCQDTGRGGALSAIGFHPLTRPLSFHFKKQLT